ncbi:cation:proton antiporter [Enterovirga rhinocerotis]|uniref:Transporter (CPA2 family) n=1 Tax=Enterovirga rhinocerotis TaxID=1339210 RepID=A0A4R7C8K8_9HYPH|nr:cation:proton antiporter [Enterovirga rhinocerotis]TDR94711.1 transporter (CPA2 family) [Enterovirga rhinocerotis]
MHSLLVDIATCTIAAWILGVLSQYARQPVILAYLVAGFLVGPTCLSLVQSQHSIETISELGLIFLLFMIGLEIDLKKIIRSGAAILGSAASQIVGGAILGVAVFALIGFPMSGQRWDALYLGVAAALSSTVIIVKVLYEKRELDTLPGRITLGLLVLQDLFAILFLAVQPSLNDLHLSVLFLSVGRVMALVVTLFVISRYLLPRFFRSIARQPELVLVGALAWCFFGSELAARLHLSREMGALVAGVALSTFPYALDVTAKVTSLRDFFVTLFFVGLGMTIPIPTSAVIGLTLGIAAFVVVSRILTTFPALYLLRQGIRASFLPALNLCQISEFSLVLMTLGLAAGHVSADVKNATSFAFVILAVVSSFAMTNSDWITRRVVRLLKALGLPDLDAGAPAEGLGEGHGAKILLLGFFRTASSLVADLEREEPELLKDVGVVDFNPVVFSNLTTRGVRVRYGDISQRETLIHAGVESAEILVLSVPDYLLKGITNERLVRLLRSLNPNATIIAPADTLDDVESLYAAGADYVTLIRLALAQDIREALAAAQGGHLDEKRAKVDGRLAERKEVLA